MSTKLLAFAVMCRKKFKKDSVSLIRETGHSKLPIPNLNKYAYLAQVNKSVNCSVSPDNFITRFIKSSKDFFISGLCRAFKTHSLKNGSCVESVYLISSKARLYRLERNSILSTEESNPFMSGMFR